MIEGLHPVTQAALGTLFTWGLTAAGSALVFLFSKGQRKILDGSLGFAAGVMTAASYWSLLEPAIEAATSSGIYGAEGQFAFIPVGVGFALGAAFVYGADLILPMLIAAFLICWTCYACDYFWKVLRVTCCGVKDPVMALSLESGGKLDKEVSSYDSVPELGTVDLTVNNSSFKDSTNSAFSNETRHRRGGSGSSASSLSVTVDGYPDKTADDDDEHNHSENKRPVCWKRIVLLILAITVHNIPEGLAVGVGFGAVGKTSPSAFAKARNLAIGIGIQNFPEGLAVSLPLRGAGMSVWKSFWYGQLSGMVEPVAGILGALAISVAEPLLPYSLAFAAGAMIYVVVDDIIPEAQMCGNGKLASFGAILGFIVMMTLDVGLG